MLAPAASDPGETEFPELYQRTLRIFRRRSSYLVYRFTRRLVRLVLFPYLSFRCQGIERLDAPGPFVIASVHRSNLDAPLLGSACSQRFRSLAKVSMFKSRAFGWYLSTLGSVPVRRGEADRQSMQVMEQLLAAGEVVLLFPEGTRQSGLQVKEIFDGCTYLAAKCAVPIVPVGIAGTEETMPPGVKLPKRAKVAVCVGEPLSVADFFARHQAAAADTEGGNGVADRTRCAPKARLSMRQRQAFSQELQKRLQELLLEANSLRN